MNMSQAIHLDPRDALLDEYRAERQMYLDDLNKVTGSKAEMYRAAIAWLSDKIQALETVR